MRAAFSVITRDHVNFQDRFERHRLCLIFWPGHTRLRFHHDNRIIRNAGMATGKDIKIEKEQPDLQNNLRVAAYMVGGKYYFL